MANLTHVIPQPRPHPARERDLVQIDEGAAANLRYIRSTMEAAHTFTTVPGNGCIAMGLLALLAASLEAFTPLAAHWLALWVSAATLACTTALVLVVRKARDQDLSLKHAVARRFFMTLAPAFVAGAILTAVLVDEVPRATIAGLWLLLYGTGVAASGVFAIRVVWGAGVAFMLLGAATFLLPAPLAPAMLALGFGGIHIVLGEIVRRRHGG
jgi:hypothetical protein